MFLHYNVAASALSPLVPQLTVSVIGGHSFRQTTMDILDGFHIFILSCESLVCAFGNGLVIIAVIKFEFLQTKTNLFVLALAICDFIMGCIATPWTLAVQNINTDNMSNSSYSAWGTACIVGNFVLSMAGKSVTIILVYGIDLVLDTFTYTKGKK